MNMRSYKCCTDNIVSDEVSSLAGVLKVISEPNRLRILCVLSEDGEHCVCELAGHMQGVSQSLLSHHIADLREAGLIESEKRGQKKYYKLTDIGKKVISNVLLLTEKGINKCE